MPAPHTRRPLALLALVIGATALGASLAAGAGGPGVRLCAGGDVSLGSDLRAATPGRPAARAPARGRGPADPDSLLAPLAPLVADADVVLLNHESAIGEGPGRPKCRPGSTTCYAVRSPTLAARALARFAGDRRLVLNVANNHSRDGWRPGTPTTGDRLRAAGLAVVGDDTVATLVPLAGGDTLAILGFSLGTSPNINEVARIRAIVAREAAKVPLLVVTAHLGAEGARFQHVRDATERYLGERRGNPVALAHAAIDAGAALFVGHGPHVLRAMEWYRGRLILYSLGNLLTRGRFSVAEPLDRGAVICVDLDHDGTVRGGEVRATVQRAAGLVRADSTRRAVELLARLSRQDFGASGARLTPAGAIIVPGPRAPAAR
jgi:hypothetical protein